MRNQKRKGDEKVSKTGGSSYTRQEEREKAENKDNTNYRTGKPRNKKSYQQVNRTRQDKVVMSLKKSGKKPPSKKRRGGRKREGVSALHFTDRAKDVVVRVGPQGR